MPPTTTVMTTPMPQPVYPPPREDLIDIKYIKTANHYWAFDQNTKKAQDKGSQDTFLHEALRERKNLPQPNDPINNHFPESVTFDNPLVPVIPSTLEFSEGLDKTDSSSLVMGSNCLKLGDLSVLQPYVKSCLSTPESCEYGISASLWVNFRDDVFVAKEVLLGTGPLVNQGFQLYYERGRLKLDVLGDTKKWHAETIMDKVPNVWNIVGFMWYKDIGEIKLYINSNVKTFSRDKAENEYLASPLAATSLFLGCSSDAANDFDPTTYVKALLNHPAIWLWPIQRSILLTGGLVKKFVKDEDEQVTTPPIVIKPPEFDYASVVDEYLGNAEEGNAFYQVASLYFDLQSIPTVSQDVNLEPATALTRYRKSIRLQKSNAYAKMKGNLGSRCAGKFYLCDRGVTYAVWIYVPSSYTSNAWSDLLEIKGSLRLSLYYQQLHVFLVTQFGSYFYQVGGFQSNTWFNLAVTVSSRMDIFQVYINGDPMSTLQRGFPPDARNFREGVSNGDIIIGSSETSHSVSNARLSDFIIWEQYLFPFQMHRAMGYTNVQLTALTQSTHYWTTNPYILSDYLALNEWKPNQYRLRSMYKQKYLNFKKELDQYGMTESAVVLSPPVNNKIFDYFFLGHKKYRIPTEADISWRDDCFTDSTASLCRGNGFSISLWIKILSVADRKIRFYLNTGDMGDAINSNDARGISVFTRGKLFGISLSTKLKGWSIIIDSNRYKLNAWFNVGILWRYDLGLRLVMDGIDYGLINDIPENRYKKEDTHYRAVVGRFDDDKNSTWFSNDIWEMSHFVFGDLIYFNNYKTPDEFARLVGLQTNVYYSTANFYLRRDQLINLPFIYLKESKKLNLLLGPNGKVNWISDKYNSGYPQIINGELILRYYSASGCPFYLSDCSKGISASAWINIHNTIFTKEYTLISFGTNNDADAFALLITPEKKLKSWIKTNKKKIVAISNVKLSMRWTNVAITWKKELGLTILINGLVAGTSTREIDEKLGEKSQPKSIRVGDKLAGMNTTIDVYNLVFYHEHFFGPQMEKVVGVKYSKLELLKLAHYFWTFNGIYRRLEPFPLAENYVDYTQDRYESPASAICTRGTKGSYVEIGQNLSTCLQNPVHCNAFIFTMNIKLKKMNTNTKGYIFSSGAQRNQQIGISIMQNGTNRLDAIIRSPNKTCTTSAVFESQEWSQIKLLWYSSQTKNPVMKADGNIIANGRTAKCITEKNFVGTNYTAAMFGRANDDNPEPLEVCLSDVSLMEFADIDEADNIEKNIAVSTLCYQGVDLSYPLYGNEIGPYGQPNTASTFPSNFDNDGCISDPSLCNDGVTVSLYVNIEDSSSTGYIFNTGEITDRGLVIKTRNSQLDNDYLDVFVVLNSGKAIWSVISSKAIKKKTWYNLAVVWSKDIGLLFYVNGIQKELSTAFREADISKDNIKSILVGQKEKGAPSLVGYVSNIVIWNEVIITCNNPRRSHKTLLGLCKEDSKISIQSQCTSLGICINGSGIVCLDKTEENIIRMGTQNLKITVPDEGKNLLAVAIQVMESNSPSENITQSVGTIFINVAENMEFDEIISSENINNYTETVFMAAETMFSKKYKKNWNTLDKSGKLSAAKVIKSLETFGNRMVKKLGNNCSAAISHTKNILFSLIKLDKSSNCNSFTFPEGKPTNGSDQYDSARAHFGGLMDQFQIPNEALQFTEETTYITAFLFDSSMEIMPNTLSNETKADNGTMKEFVVNSRLVLISISPKPPNPLPNKARVNFTLQLTAPNTYNLPSSKRFYDEQEAEEAPLKYAIKCGFWDSSMVSSESESEGSWDVKGCQVELSNWTHVSCSCEHLTSFAILMQPIPPVHSTIHDFILSVITYIGIVLSLLCLLIFIIIILIGKELCGDRYFIHLNLCVALFIAQLAFVLIEAAKDDRIFCRAIGVVMHLFFVATFFWFFFEGLFAFYAVTSGIIKGKIKYYFPIAWITSILVVGITAGLNVNAYGQNDLCWLTFEGYYLWAFLGPVLLMIFLTCLICLITVCNIGTPAIKTQYVVDGLRSHTKQTCILLPLMLCAWVLGVFMVIEYSIPLAYFFVLFNSFQGVWVFICFGLLNPEVRAIMCRRQKRPNSSSRSAIGSLTDVDKVPSSNPDVRNQNDPLPVYHPSAAPSAMSESSQSINSRRELLKEEKPEPVKRPKRKKIERPLDQPIDYKPPGTPEYD